MKKYKVEIEGATTLLFNKFDNKLNKEKVSVSKDKIPEWEEKNWKRKAYINSDGMVYLPDTYIIGCIRNAAFASGVQLSKKKGKKTISKAFIDSNLLIEDNAVICDVEELVEYSTNVKIGKATIMTIRPMIKTGWQCSIIMYDLNDMFKKDELMALLTYAGKFIGVGDWRPKHGRFNILELKEV